MNCWYGLACYGLVWCGWGLVKENRGEEKKTKEKEKNQNLYNHYAQCERCARTENNNKN